jgi:hypothetical protein
VWHVQVGRFYILYYSCIFSCRNIMWEVYRSGDFTFCTIHVFLAVERSCLTWTGWEILHFVLFMYFQLTQDHDVRRVQVGRFYILYYSCIFSCRKIMCDVNRLGDFTFCICSCRKIMWDVYRLGDFTFCTIHVFLARSCETGWATFGKYCYYFGKSRKTWNDAQVIKSLSHIDIDIC